MDTASGETIAEAPVKRRRVKRFKNGPEFPVSVVAIALAVTITIAAFAVVTGVGKNGFWIKNDTCASEKYMDQQPDDVCADAANTVVVDGMMVSSTPLKPQKATYGGGELCSRVTVTNTTNESRNYNMLDFKLQSPTGVVETTSGFAIDSDFGSGALVAGGSKSGAICTAMNRIERGKWIFIYDPSPFTDERGIWLTGV